MGLNGKWGLLIGNILILFSLSNCESSHPTCGTLKTLGYTSPQGDIVLKYGQPLDIICSMYDNKEGENVSSKMYFQRHNQRVPSEMITVLNSTSIQLHIEKPPKVEDDSYYCFYKNYSNLVCNNVVIVGVPPQKVEDFECISRNFENLTCLWTPPENYVRTDYNLTFSLKGRSARFSYECTVPIKPTQEDKRIGCFYSVLTDTQYRQAHTVLFFRLEANNTFGKSIVAIKKFDHFSYVIPNPPENLTYERITSEEVLLKWEIPSAMHAFPKGVHSRVLYKWENLPWQTAAVIMKDIKNRTMEYRLKNLEYGHALCDIRVSIRAASVDVKNETMWSQNASTTFRTLDRRPQRAPDTVVGSFEVEGTLKKRNIYVYWRHLNEREEMGDNFSYSVTVDGVENKQPNIVTKAFAYFKNLEEDRNYTFRIKSQNNIGQSLNESVVFVSKLTTDISKIVENINFLKVAVTNNMYELSWNLPKQNNSIVITNLTLFWCKQEKDRPYQCEGKLNWTVLPNNVAKYNLSLPGNIGYQFAISVNGPDYSTGMIWSECTIFLERNIGKLKYINVLHVGATYMTVAWKLGCSDRVGAVKGFIIYYCRIKSPQQTDCTGSEKHVTIHGNVSITSGNITNLTPYSTYRISVAVLGKSSTSQISNPIYYTTIETAPSAPRNVKLVKVTNSSITIRWDPPTNENGILKYYNIYFNKDKTTSEPNVNELTLTGLESYKNYTFYLEACTVHCSEPSMNITVLTKMDIPGIISKPSSTFQNTTNIFIKWTEPYPKRGKVDYYQVSFKEKYENENVSAIVNTTDTIFNIENCGESGKYNTFYLSVRAVNLIKGIPFNGPWSDELEWHCRSQGSSLKMVLLSSLFVFVFISIAFLMKKAYNWCKRMQDVEVKLPPGLTPIVDSGLGSWPEKHLHPEHIERSSEADEELLLQRINEPIHQSGDSSGCSSGHESVTSSLESGTHISTSDSGTEQRTVSNEELQRNSLRQRNVSSLRPAGKGYTTMPLDALMSTRTPTPNYCVLGVDTNPGTTDVDKPYVSLASCDLTKSPSTSPPPYVMTGDIIKTPNPGYVPYNTSLETTHPSTGYVMAGIKDNFIPELMQCSTAVVPIVTPDEEKPLYVKASTTGNMKTGKTIDYQWQQPPVETTHPKTGYVSVGDALPPKQSSDISGKGYVPHRQFEAKSLKED